MGNPRDSHRHQRRNNDDRGTQDELKPDTKASELPPDYAEADCQPCKYDPWGQVITKGVVGPTFCDSVPRPLNKTYEGKRCYENSYAEGDFCEEAEVSQLPPYAEAPACQYNDE